MPPIRTAAAVALWLITTAGCAPPTDQPLLAAPPVDSTAVPPTPAPAMAGTWDDVSFTEEEALATLALANAASASWLLDGLAIDHRAVASIVDARPLTHVQALSELYFVGPETLLALREGAIDARFEGACLTDDSCRYAWVCAGVPDDGSTPYGLCVDPRPSSSEGAACDTGTSCPWGLTCAALTRQDEGWCVPDWMSVSVADSPHLDLPDVGAVTRSLVVSGVGQSVVDLVVTIDLDHPSLHDVTAHLQPPHGALITLRRLSTEAARRSVVVLPAGLQANGTWQLVVTDHAPGSEGVLATWKLDLVTDGR